jgi:dihydroorotate dehydrogenase
MPDWSYQTIFRPLLFTLPPEQARDITLGTMGRLARAPGGSHLIEFLGHMQPEGGLTYPLLGMDLNSFVGIDSGLDAHTLGLHAIGRFIRRPPILHHVLGL